MQKELFSKKVIIEYCKISKMVIVGCCKYNYPESLGLGLRTNAIVNIEVAALLCFVKDIPAV